MFDDKSFEVKSNLDEFKLNLSSFTSQRLCEVVVTSRYLGCLKEESLLAMQELTNRRAAGEDFQYEDFIELEFKKLPKFTLQLKQASVLSAFNLIKK